MKYTRTSSLRRGFTLVELLVVIAIIAVLAGLTVVIVSYAGKKADSTKITTNMKNIYSSMIDLKGNGVNTGFHPPGSLPPYEGSLQNQARSQFVWWDLVAEQFTIADQDESGFYWSEDYSNTQFQNPFSKKKLGLGMEERTTLLDNWELSFGSFAYNAELGDSAFQDERQDRVKIVHYTEVNDTENTIFFAEAADTREDGDETPGWVFNDIKNAPQGNYEKSAHCCMLSGNVMLIENEKLKNPDTFKFLTTIDEKNYDHKP